MQTTFAISVICLVLSITASGLPVDDCERKVDEIFFILDSSRSIYKNDFKQMLTSISHFIGNVTTGNNLSTGIGVITFSNNAHLEFSSDTYTDVETLQNAILKIPHRLGQTYTSKALKLLGQQVSTLHRPDVKAPVVGIVITDGDSTDTQATVEQAKILHKMGVVMYVIGIGRRYKIEEMKKIATNPDTGVYKAADYSVLDKIFNKFYNITCLPQLPETNVTNTEGGSDKDRPVLAQLPETNVTNPEGGSDKDRPVLDKPSGDNPSKIIFGFDIVTLCRHQIQTVHDFIYDFIARSGYTYFSIVSDGMYTGHMNTPLSLISHPLQRTPDFITPIVNIVRHIHYEFKSFESSGGRQVAVLFVDSSSSVISIRVKKTLDNLKRRGVEVFIIYIGNVNWPDAKRLRSLCSQPSGDYLYRIEKYDLLWDIINKADEYKNIYAVSQKRTSTKQSIS